MTFGTDFTSFLVKALFSENECSKNADVIILSNCLATFEIFSQVREILPNTVCMPIFKSIGAFKHKLREGGG